MASIAKTQKKLREARFFLSSMSAAARSTRLDEENFEFFLSAFLSAARSVLDVIRVEGKRHYKAWYGGWKANLSGEERDLLQFINGQRIATVHQEGVEVQTEIEFVPITRVEFRGRHPAYGIGWFMPPGVPLPQIGRAVHYFERDESRQHVIETCSGYVAILQKLVQDFERELANSILSCIKYN